MLSLQSLTTLCNLEPPGFSDRGILQARTLSGLPFHSPGDFPDPWIEPGALRSPAFTSGFFTASATWGSPNHALPRNNDV